MQGMTMKYNTLLQKLNPDANSLMAALSKHVDDAMLIETAGADYGVEVDLHLEQLLKIRDKQAILAPMDWYPREVLNLTQWNEPAKGDKHSRISEAIVRPHVVRAFVCAVLTRANAEPLNCQGFDEEVSNIAGLLDSLPLLDTSIQAEALRFFAWRVQILPEFDSESPFWLIGLLVLLLRTRAPLTSAQLNELIAWIDQDVDTLRHHPWMMVEDDVERNDQWLTWLTYYKMRLSIWQALGQEIALLADQPDYSESQEALKDLASHLEVI